MMDRIDVLPDPERPINSTFFFCAMPLVAPGRSGGLVLQHESDVITSGRTACIER